MERRVWCAIAGRGKLLHVDTTSCEIVYELKKAAVDLARFKIPYVRVDIWKVKSSENFAATDSASLKRIPGKDVDIRMIADLLQPYQRLDAVFKEDCSESKIELIMKINIKKKRLPSISVPERRIWCAVAGPGRIFQVDIARCKNGRDLRKVIAKELNLQVDNLDLWKVKEPREWPVNDKLREQIPKTKDSIGEIADHIELEQIDICTAFEDEIRREHIYVIVLISGKRQLSNVDSTPPSVARRLVWCAVPGRSRLFQVNVAFVSELEEFKKIALQKSGFKARWCGLRKVKNPELWPVTHTTQQFDIPDSNPYLSEISDSIAVQPVAALETVLSEDFDENALQFLLVMPDEPAVEDVTVVQKSSATSPPARLLWCAIAGEKQVLRVDISGCRIGLDLRTVLATKEKLATEVYLRMWKVKNPEMWRLDDIVTGTTRVPGSEEKIKEIADMLFIEAPIMMQQVLSDDLDMDRIYVIVQVLSNPFCIPSSSFSSSSSSSSSNATTTTSSTSSTSKQSDPFAEIPEIRDALKDLGFGYDVFQDVDRWHVADVFKLDGEHFIAKYLRPNRCGEIKVLRYLSRFASSHNLAPSNIIIHQLDEGALLLTPHLGQTVRCYVNLSRDFLHIVQQLFEGVAFLHSKRVAHMDLKESHILVDDAGRLSIVDYDLSEILNGDGQTMSGFRGTKGCTAPEVGSKSYDPMSADAWATGKILQGLLDVCDCWKDREFLEGICERLLSKEPGERPKVHEMYTLVTEYIESESSLGN